MRTVRIALIRAYRLIPGRYRTTCTRHGHSCSQIGLRMARDGATLAAIAMMVATCAACNGGGNIGTTASCAGGGPPGIRHFARDVMAYIGAPAHGPSASANVHSFQCWAAAENTSAAYNPLATTMPEPGSTNFNQQGPVQDYPDWGTGVKATGDTILNYGTLADAFKSGAGVCGGNYSSDFQTWSGDGYGSVC